jgi:hypothetical protein
MLWVVVVAGTTIALLIVSKRRTDGPMSRSSDVWVPGRAASAACPG